MRKDAKIHLHPNRRRKLPTYRTIRCPMVGHQASWCRGLCVPHNGIGTCGRIAAHAMKGKTQIAIEEYNHRLEQKEST